MTDDRTKTNLADKTETTSKGRSANQVKPSATFIHFFLFALVTLTVGVFFQMQLVALRQELATLKLNFSTCEKSRNLRKRSSSDSEDEPGAVAVAGVEATHLLGTFPFQHVEKQGKIGPWSVASSDNAIISLKRRNTEIEISQNGVYYIYAQVYYLTSEPHNSFQILSYNGTEERKHYRNLVTCSSQGRNSMGEVSCYTGFTGSFYSGERLYLNQIEQNRIIHFTNGCSFFGVVLLKKNSNSPSQT